MKAWRITGAGRRELVEQPPVEAVRGGVVVRMQAAPVLSYMRAVLDGTRPYALPPAPFTPGTNGVGVVEQVGAGVYHMTQRDRVLVNPHLVADERVPEPAQISIGLTAMGSARFDGIPETTRALQRDWRDGTFGQLVHAPASVLTPLPAALRAMPAATLVALSKFAVPYGGFLRGGLLAGETVLVNGATGYFGSAGALLALALGAARVVAAGRDRATLESVRAAADPRLMTVALSGDVEADTNALAEAAGGRADLALDMVGAAKDANATSAMLHALRRHGRLVLMGSVAAPLARLEAALEAASTMRGLDMTVLTM